MTPSCSCPNKKEIVCWPFTQEIANWQKFTFGVVDHRFLCLKEKALSGSIQFQWKESLLLAAIGCKPLKSAP
jgi:hypothetical protein